ncbi:YeeE/YedE thiosulfate transporter family protein [uncultured Tateyamaria sp.]|uniref:YeeE/YedE family protein n=1 Tax=uncultured Tateyamaria sp. TaxID=455651 RepID=UPI00261AC82A|nr:YeeE/YedE thiosulfate transporter family protein [uncultured Tateyamaria sp.]
MQIAWIYGLIGGLCIGSAAALLLLGTGRIMGASGIVGGLIDGSGSNRGATVAFVAGLIGLPALMSMGGWHGDTQASSNVALLVLGGLTVGIGTRFANGCTSGHGVCGLSRFSLRGLVATIAYIGAGAITVTLLRWGLGL